MDDEAIAASTDVDELWRALMAARADGDSSRVRAVENRMRDLGRERRFAHLTDDELRARLASLDGNRAPANMIGHSPGGGPGGDNGGGEDLLALNNRIRENQQDGVEATRGALLDELARRTSDGA